MAVALISEVYGNIGAMEAGNAGITICEIRSEKPALLALRNIAALALYAPRLGSEVIYEQRSSDFHTVRAILRLEKKETKGKHRWFKIVYHETHSS